MKKKLTMCKQVIEVIEGLNKMFIDKFGEGKSSITHFRLDNCDCYCAVDSFQNVIYVNFHKAFKKPIHRRGRTEYIWDARFVYKLELKKFILKYCEDTIKYDLERLLFEYL